MKKLFQLMLTAACCLSMTSVSFAVTSSDTDIVTSFLHQVSQMEIADDQKSKIKSTIDGLDSVDAISEGLNLIYPEYSAAVNSSDNDEIEKAVKLLVPMTESKDKFLAADASFHLARMLMNNERFEEAMPHLEKLMSDLSEFSTQSGTAHYYAGVAQAGMLQNEKAIGSFIKFLEDNQDAAERLRVSAWRQVQSIQAIEEGKMDDISQRMDYSRRRLEQSDGDDQTQEEQDRIVDMLTKLIKEAEKKECSS